MLRSMFFGLGKKSSFVILPDWHAAQVTSIKLNGSTFNVSDELRSSCAVKERAVI